MIHSVRIETERQVLGDGAAFIKLSLPVAEEGADGAFAKSLTAYTEGLKKGFMRYATGTLVPAAASRGGGAPYGGALNAVLCHQCKEVLSLYLDATVTDGKWQRIYRLPLMWNIKQGVLIKPERLFKKGVRKQLLPLILRGIEEKSAAVSAPLYSDYSAIARRRFDTERFYISPYGGVFYYQGRTLNDRPEPFALPLSLEVLRPLLRDGVAELLWDCTEEQ